MTKSVEPEMATDGKLSASSVLKPTGQVMRIKSRDLLQQMREVEIDHEGRIYRLRVTQLNKLILTA